MMRRCLAFRVGITTANYITAVILLSSWSSSSSCHIIPVAFAATLIHPGGGGTTQAAVEPTTRRGPGPTGIRRRFHLKESICRVLHHRQPVLIRKEPTQWEQYQTRWFRLPEPVRFFVSGNCGNVCLFLCDWMVSLVLPPISSAVSSFMPITTSTTTTTTTTTSSSLSSQSTTTHPAVAFFLAYLLHIPAQHALHAALVYGWSSIARTRRQYVTTLLETYSALSLSSVVPLSMGICDARSSRISACSHSCSP
jgi:hypothetical protein